MAQVQNDSGFFLAEANAALKDGIDIAVGPCSVRVPAQAVADARAGWNAARRGGRGCGAAHLRGHGGHSPPAACGCRAQLRNGPRPEQEEHGQLGR